MEKTRRILYKHDVLRQAADEKQPNVTDLCKSHGFSRGTYYGALKGSKSLTVEMIQRVANALGLKLTDVFTLSALYPAEISASFLSENVQKQCTPT